MLLVGLLTALLFATSTSAQNKREFRQTVRIGRGNIRSLNWHPDSSLLVANSATGVWVYNDALETVLHLSDVTLATFSPAGGFLAGIDDQNQLLIWDDQDFEVVYTLTDLGQEIIHLAWSPDGNFLAGKDRGGHLVIWDTTEWQPYSEFTAEITYTGYYAQFAWSPEGLHLAVQEAGQILIWSLRTRSFTATIASSGEIIWRNEQQLVTAVTYEATSATLWDVDTGKELAQYRMGGYGFVLSPDANLAAAAWGSVDIVDVATSETAFEFDPGYYEAALAWKPDSTWLAVGEGGFSADVIGTIQILDTETGEIVRSTNGLIGSAAPEKLVWSPDGEKLAAVGWLYGELAIWDVNHSDQLKIMFDHSLVDTPMIWSPDGNQLLTADGSGSVQVWDSQTGNLIATLAKHDMPVHEILWQPNGQILVTSDGTRERVYGKSSRHDSVRFWDMHPGELSNGPLQTLSCEFPLSGMAWNRQGTELAIIDHESGVLIWSAAEKQIVREFPSLLNHGNVIKGIGWDFEGTMLIMPFTGTGHLRVSAWDAITGSVPYTHKDWPYYGISDDPLAEHWMPDNSYITVTQTLANDEDTELCRTVLQLRVGYSGSEQWPKDFSLQYSLMSEDIKHVAFSSDGHRLASLDRVGTLMIWDTRSGVNVLTVNNIGDFSIGGQIFWSPDGNQIAIGGEQQPITIFDAHTGTLEATLQPSDQNTYFPVWSPDSRHIAVSTDGIVTIWTQ